MTRRALLLGAVVAAQAAESEERVARRRFQAAVAQAIAYRKVLRAMESRLEEHGFSLHPETEARRAAIEASLDTAEELLEKKQWAEALEEVRRAEGHLARLRQSL